MYKKACFWGSLTVEFSKIFGPSRRNVLFIFYLFALYIPTYYLLLHDENVPYVKEINWSEEQFICDEKWLINASCKLQLAVDSKISNFNWFLLPNFIVAFLAEFWIKDIFFNIVLSVRIPTLKFADSRAGLRPGPDPAGRWGALKRATPASCSRTLRDFPVQSNMWDGAPTGENPGYAYGVDCWAQKIACS